MTTFRRHELLRRCRERSILTSAMMTGMDEDDLVQIASFSYRHEAEFAVSVLEAAGIDAVVRDGFFAGLRPHVLFASGGVPVFVRGSDAEVLTIPKEVFQHRAVLYTGDHVAFSEVVETYQSQVLAFRREPWAGARD